jgi:hypothetical protein
MSGTGGVMPAQNGPVVTGTGEACPPRGQAPSHPESQAQLFLRDYADARTDMGSGLQELWRGDEDAGAQFSTEMGG